MLLSKFEILSPKSSIPPDLIDKNIKKLSKYQKR
uniref:Uncharacterized protein n=1 Tax=Rhizophora mucronata TaxID=61149 RepID=A0A2P2R417_RHIMU